MPDILERRLRVVFCGINPGLYSAATGCHFAHPGNRFWKALHRSGFTDRRLEPDQQKELPDYGCGLTNMVDRTTVKASELSREELKAGRRSLAGKMGYYRPNWLAILGLGAYRTGFGEPDASPGPVDRTIGDTGIWVLPNPSGLNAHYSLEDFTRLFSELRRAAIE